MLSTISGALLVLLLFIGPQVRADQPLWPVKGDIDLFEGFCEFRTGHFHGGIDIRTGGEEGRRIYSPVDGYVWRIKHSYIGYGKGLYLKDNNGYIYVFGHLSRLADKIRKVIFQKQYVTKRYYFDDVYPSDSIPVEAGELIAWSGQSGFGAPHIHFEKRTPDNQPLNPLTNGFTLEDFVPPSFKTVGFIYQDSISIFPNGERRFNVKVSHNRKNNSWFIDSVICLTGSFGLAIDAFDQIRNQGPQLNIYSARLFIDDYLYYENKYEKYDYAQTKMVNLSYDFPLVIQRLYRHLLFEPVGKDFDGSSSEYSTGGIFSGQTKYSLGPHEARIEIDDAAGNRAELNFRFVYLPQDNLFRTEWINDTTLYLMADPVNRYLDISGINVYQISGFNKWVRVDSEFVKARGSGDYMLTLPSVRSGVKALQLVLIGKSGWVKNDLYIAREAAGQTRYSFKYDLVDGGLLFHAFSKKRYTPPPSVEIFFEDGYSKRINLKTYKPNQFAAYYKNETISSRIVRLELYEKNFETASVSREVNIFLAGLTPGEKTSVSSDKISLTIESEDLYQPASLEVRRRSKGLPKGNQLVGNAYEISPAGLPLKSDIELSFKLDGQDDFARLGIFKLNHRNKWKYVTSEIKDKRIVASSSRTGTFGLLTDNKSPRVKKIYPGRGKTVFKKYPKIRFKISDDLSGIENDRNISVTIDGQFCIPEYDPETEWLKTYPRYGLTDGRHELKIVVSDRAGNSREVISFFYVKSDKK